MRPFFKPFSNITFIDIFIFRDYDDGLLLFGEQRGREVGAFPECNVALLRHRVSKGYRSEGGFYVSKVPHCGEEAP